MRFGSENTGSSRASGLEPQKISTDSSMMKASSHSWEEMNSQASSARYWEEHGSHQRKASPDGMIGGQSRFQVSRWPRCPGRSMLETIFSPPEYSGGRRPSSRTGSGPS